MFGHAILLYRQFYRQYANTHFYGTVFIANTGISEYAEVGVYGNGGLLAMQVRDIINASLTLAMRMVTRSVPASSAAQRNHILSHSAQRLPSYY